MLEFLEFTKKKTTNNLIKAGFVTSVGAIVYFKLFAPGKPLSNLLGTITNPFGGSGQTPVTVTPGCSLNIFRKASIEKIADEWYNNFSGVNFLTYPETAIKILPFNNCEIAYFNDYFVYNYGTTPFTLLSGEWASWDYEYDSVLNKLTAEGFGS